MQRPQVAPSFVGRRVAWCGPTQRGFLPVERRQAILAGIESPPAPEDQLELRPGDLGEVIELVSVTGAGEQYAIRFANGYEIETILPTKIVAVLG